MSLSVSPRTMRLSSTPTLATQPLVAEAKWSEAVAKPTAERAERARDLAEMRGTVAQETQEFLQSFMGECENIAKELKQREPTG